MESQFEPIDILVRRNKCSQISKSPIAPSSLLILPKWVDKTHMRLEIFNLVSKVICGSICAF